jgi:hypothetical protein
MTASVDQLLQSAVKARQRAQSALTTAVQEARADGWSWERISAALGGSPNPQTLRRAFAVGEAAPDRTADGPPGCGEGSCACAGCQAH